MAEAVTPPPAPAERSHHAPRFALLLGVLAGIAIGAIALAAALIADGGPGPSRDWSAWAPSEHGTSAAQQIANHVARDYRLPDGRQLVFATGGPLELAHVPLHLARSDPNGAVEVLDGSGALFTLCGGGTSCSVEGKPSIERGLLLHREAVELGLYALHYLGVENVVVLLPPTYLVPIATKPTSGKAAKPAKAKPTSTAMLLRRDQFSSSLDEPLSETLPVDVPSATTILRAPETRFVSAVTDASLFKMRIAQSQDGTTFLVLEPLPTR